MGAELREQCANLTTEAPRGNSPGCLFVSTSLATWTTASPEQFARDFQINDTVYRRLDPEYYAWLRHKLTLAEKALEAGKIDYEAFDTLLEKALIEEMPDYDYAPVLRDFEVFMTALGVMPFDEADLPPEDPATF